MRAVIESTVEPTVTEPRSGRGDPVWEIAAELYPVQGDWSEDEYLALDTNRLIEFTDGVLEFLPVPTLDHQDLLAFLYDHLKPYVASRNLGKVVLSGYAVRVGPEKHRKPDLMFLSSERLKHNRFTEGADLVMEIVSGSSADRKRDLVEKREEYAEGGIPESWIVDPQQQTITVLTLADDSYQEHGVFKPGETATSVLLEGFNVTVTVCFAAAQSHGDQRDGKEEDSQ